MTINFKSKLNKINIIELDSYCLIHVRNVVTTKLQYFQNIHSKASKTSIKYNLYK